MLGKCGGTFSDILDGVAWAGGLSVPGVPPNNTPAQVINLSLGDSNVSACEAAEQSVFNAVLAHGVTRAIVIAAGNEHDDVANHSPANCSGVISVGATNSAGNRANYSNFGATLTISAPGGQYPQFDGIYTLIDSGTTTPVGDSARDLNGTSFSAPIAAGVVSLMLAVAPNLTADQVRTLLTSSAKPFPVTSNCRTGLCGAGIVNAQAAVQAAQVAAGGVNFTDLWWFGQTYNGTGISIIQHNDTCSRPGISTTPTARELVCDARRHLESGPYDFSGAMYSTVGAPFNNYSPPATGLLAGTLSFQFSDSSNGTLSYVLTTGQSGAFAMTRQPFGPVVTPTHSRLQRFVVGRTLAGRMGPDAEPALRHAGRDLVHLRARRQAGVLHHA